MYKAEQNEIRAVKAWLVINLSPLSSPVPMAMENGGIKHLTCDSTRREFLGYSWETFQ